jgi:AraC family transcriptional regulator
VPRKRTVPILLSDTLPAAADVERDVRRAACAAGATAQLAFANIAHQWMPPHAADGYTSVTRVMTLGVSFSGHRRAVHRFRGAPIREADIAPGGAFIMMSGELEWLEVSEPSEALEVHVTPALLESVGNELGASSPVVLPDVFAADDPILLSASQLLRADLLHGSGIDRLRAETIVRALIEHSMREYGRVKVARRATKRLDMRRLRRVSAFVRERLNENLSLAELAREAALTPFHFARCFRHTTGITPGRFLRTARMQRASELARTTALSTAALAEHVGYTNVAHFRKAFVYTFGCTPAKLRVNTPRR